MSKSREERPALGSHVDMTDEGVHWDLRESMSYGDYLGLDKLLDAQRPRSGEHDEMLFIVIHQASELWMKLCIHELEAALDHVRRDVLGPAFKMLARVARVQAQLAQSWDVLATMTPYDYSAFRESLGRSSGFQSYQYRSLEYLIGNKNPAMIEVHRHDPVVYARLHALLHRPSLYDECLRLLVRRGYALPGLCLERDLEHALRGERLRRGCMARRLPASRGAGALRELADRHRRWLEEHAEHSPAALCAAAACGRAQLEERRALPIHGREGAISDLAAFAAGDRPARVHVGRAPARPRRVAFLFTGQGSQFAGMGRELYAAEPVFRAALDRCGELTAGKLERPLLEVILGDDRGGTIHETAYTQPALFALGFALAELWRSWGVAPDAVIGHSVGEFTAACVAGALDLGEVVMSKPRFVSHDASLLLGCFEYIRWRFKSQLRFVTIGFFAATGGYVPPASLELRLRLGTTRYPDPIL